MRIRCASFRCAIATGKADRHRLSHGDDHSQNKSLSHVTCAIKADASTQLPIGGIEGWINGVTMDAQRNVKLRKLLSQPLSIDPNREE